MTQAELIEFYLYGLYQDTETEVVDIGNWKSGIVYHSLAHENSDHSYRAAVTKKLSENLVYREKDDVDAWHRQRWGCGMEQGGGGEEEERGRETEGI